LMKRSEDKIQEYKLLLENVQLLEPLLDEERVGLAKALIEISFYKTCIVFTTGPLVYK